MEGGANPLADLDREGSNSRGAQIGFELVDRVYHHG